MPRRNEPVLIVSDNELELDEIVSHLSVRHTRIYATLEQDAAIEWFEENSAALLLLCFRSLHLAEAFYLKLFRRCERVYEIPHQVVVFVVRSELERAYELCRRQIFHSFVIVRPMLSEHFLRLEVDRALEKRESQLSIQRGQGLLKRLAVHVENLREEFDQLIVENKHLLEKQRSSQHGLTESIYSRLSMFRDSLTGPDMHKVVTVHDADALNEEFEQLQEKEIAAQLEYYHYQMTDAFNSWTGNLEKHLSMLEHVSADVDKGNEPSVPRILVVDDDEIQRHMLNSVLESEGYVVLQATNGNEGMSMLLAEHPDLVLLDYEMPDLDGVELLRKVRLSKSLQELPIIMLTGHSEKDVVHRCLMCGANDYLVKPVELTRLHERLRQHFPHHRQQA